MTIETRNPATGELIQAYEEMSESKVKQIIDTTHDVYLKWRETPFEERSKLMKNAVKVLEKNKEQYAILMANEMGKPIAAGRAEIDKCKWVCEYYAENAATLLQPREVKTEAKKSYIAYRPIGIVFAIMPWNFPFWQVFRFAAPNLMAGNAALLSHAPISTGTGLAIEALLLEAGFPEDLFRTLVVSNEVAGSVIRNEKVKAVTLTGSEGAGKIVGAEAASSLKKVVLELGGSDPYVILEDADLEIAAEACVASRMNNSGQVCIAAKRLIAVDAIRSEFEKLVLEKLKRYKMGDPLDESINFGPIAREDLRDQVHSQVQECLDKGATLLTGGVIPDREGYFYPPTAIKNVKKGMPAIDDEIFGPVIAFVDAKDEAEAIKLANESRFGLAGAVFTQDLKRGEEIACDKIFAGTCYVNGFVASDPRLPFGGIKASGYGRELSEEGIHEFVNAKTICVKE